MSNIGPFPEWIIWVIVIIGLVMALFRMLPIFRGGYGNLQSKAGNRPPYEDGDTGGLGGR